MAKIGQGTFGEVWKAKCTMTQRVVALKKVLMENEREAGLVNGKCRNSAFFHSRKAVF